MAYPQHIRLDYKKLRMANGLTLLQCPGISSGVMAVQLMIKTGSIHEGRYLGSGVSHFLEHMVFKGNQNRDHSAIAQEIENAGGHLNAYTTFDHTCFFVTGPSEALPVAIEILIDLAFRATLPQDAFEGERDVILREIDMYDEVPEQRWFQEVMRALFHLHPYRFPIIGERPLVEALGREELADYYHQRYLPNHALLSIAGDFAGHDGGEMVAKSMQGLAMKSSEPVFVPAEPRQMSPRRVDMEAPIETTQGAVLYRVPGMGQESFHALRLLPALLGQGESTPLWRTLREQKELVYHISCQHLLEGAYGVLAVHYVCAPGKQQQVEEAIIGMLEHSADDMLSDELLRAAIHRRIVDEMNARQTTANLASRVAAGEYYLGDPNHFSYMLKQYRELDISTMRALMKTHLREDQRTCAVLTPQKQHAPEISNNDSRDTPASPNIKMLQLNNGIRVVLQPKHDLPKIHIQAIFRGASCMEQLNEKGASGVLATLLTKDTDKRRAEEVADLVDAQGIQFEESVGNNTLSLGIEALQEDWETMVDLLVQATRYPRFQPTAFEKERAAQLSALREQYDDVGTRASLYLRKHFFGDHPLAWCELGEEKSLENLDLDTIRRLYEKIICPVNLVISVCGAYDEGALLEALESHYGDMGSNGSEIQDLPLHHPNQLGRVCEVSEDVQQTHVYVAYPSVGVADRDLMLSRLLQTYFSSMSGPLFEEIREKRGLAYHVSASSIVGVQAGMFCLKAGTTHDKASTVLEIMQEQLEAVQKNHLDTDAFQRCKTSLLSQKRLSLETIKSRASHAGLNCIFGLPVDGGKTEQEQIQSATPEQLCAFARRFQSDHKLEYIYTNEQDA